MLKFFLYLLLFYIAARLIFGRALGGGTVRTKVFRFDTHHHYHQPPQNERNEGSLKVDKRTMKPNKDDKNIGEYVDYEEVN